MAPIGTRPAGIERMQHALSLIVLHQLLLEGPKDFRVGRFEMKTDFVDGTATADD